MPGWIEQTPQPGVENPFTDVSENDWFYDDVMYLFANRLMNGTSATTFALTEQPPALWLS